MWLSILAVIVSFAGGFLVANSLNSGELKTLRAENDRLRTSTPDPSTPNSNQASGSTLSDEEIRKRLAEAENNKEDLEFQKKIGFSLYAYAISKQDVELLIEVTKVLERARSLNPKDRDVMVALSNAYFGSAYFGKNNAGYEKAREAFRATLALKPDDADIQCEIGMTYFLPEPSDMAKAITEYQKALKIDPEHEKTLQYLVQAYARSGNKQEAEKTLAQLKEITPNSPAIAELAGIIEKATAEAK